MKLSVDIGGTHIRLKLSDKYVKYVHNAKSFSDLLSYIDKFLVNIVEKIDLIVIAIPCIVDDYTAYNQTNLIFMNNCKLPKLIQGINTVYMNDGDLSLLGEIEYNNINYKN